MKDCRNCKYFMEEKKLSNPRQCTKRDEKGKAGDNFGFLFFNLAEECPDYNGRSEK